MPTHGETSVILVDKAAEWLMQSAFTANGLDVIVQGCCDRLAAAGMSLYRAQITFSVLHPLYRAMGFTWRRTEGLKVEGYRHVMFTGDTDRFKKSPFYALVSHKLEYLRRRIVEGVPAEFPILEDLRTEGVTDYLAFFHSFEPGQEQGMMGSWASDREGGFSDADIAALLRIQNHLAVATKMAVLQKLAGNMLKTYVGPSAGKRVLSGQIKRGDGETVRAAIVMADMRQSTMLAEQLGRQGYIDTLNAFFDALAQPIVAEGGELLSFVGDGFLAIFPCDRNKAASEEACHIALKASRKAVKSMAEANAQRRAAGESEIGFGIGLHVGNVMFGNVGLKDRLTFSAFGAAVNEAQRLEALTKKHPTPIIASDAFVEYCGGRWTALGTEQLRGIQNGVAVFAPPPGEPLAEPEEIAARTPEHEYSDAENVVLLHRDAQKQSAAAKR
jgi:adenylate cyclase